MRLVIDTNVIVSALLFGGTAGRILPLYKSGSIVPYATKEMIDEYLRVLGYPKFRLTTGEIEVLLYHEILPYFQIADTPPGPPVVASDPSDDMFVHCAVAAEAEVIVSGDRHLLDLGRYEDIEIVSVAELLARLQKS